LHAKKLPSLLLQNKLNNPFSKQQKNAQEYERFWVRSHVTFKTLQNKFAKSRTFLAKKDRMEAVFILSGGFSYSLKLRPLLS
jgi:hypothetical protein